MNRILFHPAPVLFMHCSYDTLYLLLNSTDADIRENV